MKNVDVIVLLLFCITFLALISYRYKFPFPIMLVLAGLGISLIPGLPSIVLKPEIVFFIFLPPLLYEAAWNTSWIDFKNNIRPIALASIGLVFFTTICVAVVAHTIIPGFTWPLSFLLGAIVSPPDAVAATSITKGLGLHPRIVTILEGESLINDASALIAYKYALAAILAGSFSIHEAGANFLIVFTGGIAVGFLVGYFMYWLHKKWINDAILDVTVTFLTPFASYLLAEQFHLSGVLAIVTTGLYLSFRSADIFSHKSRIQAYAVWEVVAFILNAFVFVLIGLQMKIILPGLEEGKLIQLLSYGLIVSLVALIVRFAWIIPAAIVPRMLSRKIRETEYFDKRNLLIFTWAGMRGIVSMAAALALPLTFDHKPFPYRSEIIFITFFVILFTLIIQGLSLPWIVKKLKLPKFSVLMEEYNVREQLLNNTQKYIAEKLANVSDELKEMLMNKYKTRYKMLESSLLPSLKEKSDNPATAIFNKFGKLQLELLDCERELLYKLRKEGKANETVIRKVEREIDLEEARLRAELHYD